MRKKERRGGIERKILTSILWVGIIPMALALIIGYTFAREATRLGVQRSLAGLAQKTAEGLSLALNARLRSVGTLSRDMEVVNALMSVAAGQTGELESLKRRLESESRNAGEGPVVVSLYDAQGALVFSTHKLPEQDQRLTSWQRAIEGPQFVDFLSGPDELQYGARVLAPVYGPETGPPIGFLSTFEGVNSLLDFAFVPQARRPDEPLSAETCQVAYGGPKGLRVSHFDEAAMEETPPLRFEAADPRLVEAIANEPECNSASLRLADYKTADAEVDVHLAYHRLSGWGDMYIIAYRPSSVVYADLKLGALLAFLGSAFVIPFFCVIAYRNVHKDIARPIALLNEGAQIIRQGDLDLKLKIGTGDEIEELASSFNKMALVLKRNIRQLEESEEKYRSLVTSMREGVCQADTEGVITFINLAGLEILGYEDVDDVVGRNLRELFLEEADRAYIANKLAQWSVVERTLIWMKRRDGEAICVELSVNRLSDDEGKFIGEEGIFRDVTKSVRLEREARERSERIHVINQIANVINSSLEAGRLYESIGAEMKKLVGFDYATVALLTESGDAFETRQLWPERNGREKAAQDCNGDDSVAAWVARERKCLIVDDLHGDDAPFAGHFPEDICSCLSVPLYAIERIIGTLNLGAKRPGAFSKHHKDVLEEVTPHVAVAIRNAQLLENLQVSLEEVTRAREKLYEANEELKTLDKTKTHLLSNVSHELRTPLVSVMGYTDMILHEKAGPIGEAQREYLTISLRNVEKLVTLIENLLDFSRLHRGAEELVLDTFDLARCVRTSMQIVNPVADGRRITLKLVTPEEPVRVDGDKGKLGQVFNNLLSNAVKFNHNGGTVTIELRPSQDSVEVAVRDTGIGVPPEALDKVFSRFYQVDGSSTRKYGGTGIGLAIAQDIVRLHGSRITVTSEVGKGSVFRFSLPIARAQKGQGQQAGLEPSPSLETRLLIELVTENRALIAQLGNLLVSEGMDVIHASQAAHAIFLARKYGPDCILVDVEPEDNGCDVLDDLLAESTAVDKPIIMLTNDDALYECYRSRVAARINRGFDRNSLLRGIHYALGQGIAVAEAPIGKILCVDDDGEVLTFMRRCLEAEGYAVESCSSGEESIELAKGHDYGLVLLDIAMPGMDGWETCRRIKSDASLAGIKVCFVTAKPIDISQPRMQECGIDGCLLKPFKSEDLVGLVQGFTTGGTAPEI